MNISYRLVPFGLDAPAPARDLARLHAALLPASPVSLLGRSFMERFYYSILPREGLICGALACVDNNPAGFVAATHDPAGFMRAALRRWWPRILWLIGTSVLTHPRSMAAVSEAVRVMMGQRQAGDAEPHGEILSLGVLACYREPHFIRQSGLRLSNDLLDTAVNQLRMKGSRAIRATVRADNTAAKLLYNALGWTLDDPCALGWRHPIVQFVWRTDDPRHPSTCAMDFRDRTAADAGQKPSLAPGRE